VRDQIAQQVGFHQRERQRAIADPKFQRVEVDGFSRERIFVVRLAQPLGSPQQAADAREQNRQLGRLGQVVVRAGGEPFQHVFRAPARGQHQHGHELLRGAKLRYHGEAILSRQHHIEHDEIELGAGLPEQALEGAIPRIDDFGLEALRLEVEAEPLGQVQLVLHDQHALHVRRPVPLAAAA
jgi:hypothetical protein